MLLSHPAWTFAHMFKSQKLLGTFYNSIRSSTQDFNMSTNDKLFKQMFIQFLQTQVTVPAPHASNIKSERTPDLDVFLEKESSIQKNHESFKTLEISFNLKKTLNLNHMLTLKAWIAYTFSRTSGTAQGYIVPKI